MAWHSIMVSKPEQLLHPTYLNSSICSQLHIHICHCPWHTRPEYNRHFEYNPREWRKKKQKKNISAYCSMINGIKTRLTRPPNKKRDGKTFSRFDDVETFLIWSYYINSCVVYILFIYLCSPGRLSLAFREHILTRRIIDWWSSDIFGWRFRFNNWYIFIRGQCSVDLFTWYILFLIRSNGILWIFGVKKSKKNKKLLHQTLTI